MKTILFVGYNPNKPNHIEPAKERGYTLVLLKKNPSEQEKKLFDHILAVNPLNLKEVLTALKEFNKKHKIDGVLTRFEPYVPIVAAIAEEFNLLAPDLKSALNAREKLFMRQAFARKNVPSPKFLQVNNTDDLKNASKELGFPLLFKPSCGAKSRFLCKLQKKEDIEKTYKFVTESVKNSRNNLFKPIEGLGQFKINFLAEELIKGQQVTTTSLVLNKKIIHLALADLVTAQDKGINAFYLISRTTPSLLSKEKQEEVCKISTMGIEALGLNNTPLHPELIITENSPKVIEIAARVGGYRTEMTKEAFGISLDEAAIDICLGNKPNLEKKYEKAATAVEIWPDKSGVIKKIDLDEIKELPYVKHLELNKKAGDVFKLPPYGDRPIGSFITIANNPKKSSERAEEVLEKIKVIF